MPDIMQAIFDAVNGWMSTAGTSFVDEVGSMISQIHIYFWGDSLCQGTNMACLGPSGNWLWAAHMRVAVLAWAILILKAGAEALRFYIARDAGEGISSPLVLFRRIVTTTVAMSVITFAFSDGHGITATMGMLIKMNVSHYSRFKADDSTPTATPDPKAILYKKTYKDLYQTLYHNRREKWLPDMQDWLLCVRYVWLPVQTPPSSTNPPPKPAPTGCAVSKPSAIPPGQLLFRLTMLSSITLGILAFYIQQTLRAIELQFAWLVGPLLALSPLTTDDYLKEGSLAIWIREVFVLSFSQVLLMVVMMLMYEIVRFETDDLMYVKVVTILGLIGVGTQGPRVLRQFAWGNEQAQGISSKLMKLPY